GDNWLWRGTPPGWEGHALAESGPPMEVAIGPSAVSSTGVCTFHRTSKVLDGVNGMVIRERLTGPDWLEFLEGSVASATYSPFSRDGRFVAWVSPDGCITVADLQELRKELQAFERELPGQ